MWLVNSTRTKDFEHCFGIWIEDFDSGLNGFPPCQKSRGTCWTTRKIASLSNPRSRKNERRKSQSTTPDSTQNNSNAKREKPIMTDNGQDGRQSNHTLQHTGLLPTVHCHTLILTCVWYYCKYKRYFNILNLFIHLINNNYYWCRKGASSMGLDLIIS